ncbi:MAG: ROK family protein [Chloroflexi bacterium]|nr:ROK family protein [Chloroflexota bacterium]
MPDSIAIGVDLGGTKIAFAAVNRAGEILDTHTEPTLAKEGVDAVIGRIIQGIEHVGDGYQIAGIGIGAPGPAVDGVVMGAANLGWKEVPLAANLRARLPFDVPVWVHNDVNAGTVAEMIFGAARGVRDFVYLAVGTGLGGGAVINGGLINGVTGAAMEVGHMSLDPHGRLCTCGGHGCVEMSVSGKGLVSAAQAYLPDYPESALNAQEPTTRLIMDAARAGDPLAKRVMDEAATALGITMAWSVMVLNPTLIVIGGGLAQAAADLMFEQSCAAMRERLFPQLRTQIQVARSQVEASALGAAALVWHELDK